MRTGVLGLRRFWPLVALFAAFSAASLYLASRSTAEEFWFSLLSVGSLAVLGVLLIRATVRRLHASEQRYRHLLNTANDGVVAVDPASGQILGGNHKLAAMAGRSEDELIGRRYQDLFPETEREALTGANGRLVDGVLQLHLLHRDGRLTPVEVSASYTLWDDQEALIALLRDVTERRAHERRIEYLASHDPLTGLANRREFERLAELLLDERRGRGHALLYLDLDQFKVVNDTCGHAAGDELLRAGVEVLVATLPDGEDPDSLVRSKGSRALQQYLRDAVDVLERKIQILERRDLFRSISGVRRAVDALLPTVRAASDEQRQGQERLELGHPVGQGHQEGRRGGGEAGR